MALKFLNKKGWHTGSLRNIENVWKAEQKHDAEQKKLEELRKQIHEERERSEFRQIQVAAGLVPRQERLDFLYESGLAVGKGSSSSEGFKALEAQPSGGASSAAVEASSSKAAVPGALFEEKEKPQSANDAWRKLHSDPLLLIRQREQEALARIKNNPIRMAMIRKSAESESKQEEVKKERKKKRSKRKHDHSKSNDRDPSKSQSDSEYSTDYERHRRRRDRSAEWQQRSNAEDKEDRRNESKRDKGKINHAGERHENCSEEPEKQHSSMVRSHSKYSSDRHKHSEHDNHSYRDHSSDKYAVQIEQKEKRNGDMEASDYKPSSKLESGSKHRSCGNEEKRSDASTAKRHHTNPDHNSDARNAVIHCQKQKQNAGYNNNNNRRGVPKMTEEEREARLREMQMNAELHEEQRWKRLKKAAEVDATEAKQATYSRGKSFLDATQKSVYGMEEGGSATIEESVRRRTYYSQGRSAHESNAFRR